MAEPLPLLWMPAVRMDRIILHWTAGAHKANATDRRHYHFIVEADGKIERGNRSIADNVAPLVKDRYAAHTRNANSYSIGVSLACMGGATESPFVPGKWPMTRAQYDRMVEVVADLCRRYKLAVTDKTVLWHSEVQANLGIKQRGKWDATRLAFDPGVKGARACGDRLRRDVQAALMGMTKRPVAPTPVPPPKPPDMTDPPFLPPIAPGKPVGPVGDAPLPETAGPEKERSAGSYGLWAGLLLAVGVTGGAVYFWNPLGWW